MILFDLKCDQGHAFEAWFKDSAAYEKQAQLRVIECPTCGSTKVSKALMAPAIGKGTKNDAKTKDDARKAQAAQQAFSDMVHKLKDHVEKNCDYVGDKFAEEARKIHYGEEKSRSIYGQTTQEETRELIEEGIEIAPLPFGPSQKQDS